MSNLQTEISVLEQIRKVTVKLEQELISLRRRLHAHPELSHQEEQTSGHIATLLRQAGYEVQTNVGGFGLVCQTTSKSKYTIGFRGDMDALPVTEDTGLAFSSTNAGVMHACGHDVHTTIVAGLALILKKMERELPVNVRFLFQPAEEATEGGAVKLIDAGVADGLLALFGVHVDPGIDLGRFGVRNGAMMASIDFVEIMLKGRGGHGAYPEQTVDPIRLSSMLLQDLYQLPEKEFSGERVVLSFGQITSGTNHNVIPDTCLLKGTFRTFSHDSRKKMSAMLRDRVGLFAENHGAQAEVMVIPNAPPVMNDEKLGSIMTEAIETVHGSGALLPVEPMMASEDFAFYADRCPTYFLRLGSGSSDKTRFGLHNSRFDVDERVIALALQVLATLPFQFNSSGEPSD